jgi:hypothetical protein
MFKKIIALSFCATSIASNLFAEAQDFSLGLFPYSGYVLQRGVLQIDAYGNYSDVDLGEALGLDFSGAKGVGSYSELGGRVWFGLTDLTTATFMTGASDFEYGQNTTNITYQEFRLKRAVVVDNPTWGFWAVEGSWFRHSMNKFSGSGLNLNPPQNRSDYGYGLKLCMTRGLSETWDLNSHLGYNKALEDGSNGQYAIEAGLGVSRFWSQRYRFDLYATTRQVSDSDLTGVSNRNNSLHAGITRYLSDHWSVDLRAQYNDNLFRGIWPFLDNEIGNISITDYGYISLGFSYRTHY